MIKKPLLFLSLVLLATLSGLGIYAPVHASGLRPVAVQASHHRLSLSGHPGLGITTQSANWGDGGGCMNGRPKSIGALMCGLPKTIGGLSELHSLRHQTPVSSQASRTSRLTFRAAN